MRASSALKSRLRKKIWVRCGITFLSTIGVHAQTFCPTLNIATPLPKPIQRNLHHAYASFVNQNKYLQNNKTRTQNMEDWLKEARLAIEPYGYFEPKLTHHWQQNKTCVQSVLNVKLGPATTIETIHWHITPTQEPTTLIGNKKDWPVYPGMVFNTPQFEKAKSTIRHIISEQGYKNVDLRRTTLLIDPKKHRARIDFYIDLGDRHRFGPITWTHGILSDALLQRFIPLHVGQHFSELTLQQIQDNLQKTGYFSLVKVHYHFNQNHDVPIHFELKPANKAHAIYGLGYDSETKITGIFNIKFNRLNADGHIFEAQTNISKNKPYINLEYLIPGPSPIKNHYAIKSLFKYNKISKNKEKSSVLTFKYQSTDTHRKMIASLNYLLNHSHPPLSPSITTHLFYPSLTLSWRHRYIQRLPFITAPIEQQFDYSILGSTKKLSSSLDLVQVQSHYHAKIPLHPLLRLLVASHLGFNRTNHPADQPDITKLKLGGSNGLRGYAYNSLMGDPLAKKLKLKAMTVEMQYQLMPNLYMATFIDAGNIVPNWRDPIKKSAGFGLTYGTPIGDINVSLARPIHTPSSTWRINLTYTN